MEGCFRTKLGDASDLGAKLAVRAPSHQLEATLLLRNVATCSRCEKQVVSVVKAISGTKSPSRRYLINICSRGHHKCIAYNTNNTFQKARCVTSISAALCSLLRTSCNARRAHGVEVHRSVYRSFLSELVQRSGDTSFQLLYESRPQYVG